MKDLISRGYVVALLEICEEYIRRNPDSLTEDHPLSQQTALVEEIVSRLHDTYGVQVQ